MGVLSSIVGRYAADKPFEGKQLLVFTHATRSTLDLVRSCCSLGATVSFRAVHYSCDKSVLDKLRQENRVTVLESNADLVSAYNEADIILEDGARVFRSFLALGQWPKFRPNVFAIEQTTSGLRLYERKCDGTPPYPVVAVADSKIKLTLENALAAPESILTSFLMSTGTALARKSVLVLGYGGVGSGMALLCRTHGARITVAETDQVKCLIARAQGFASVPNTALHQIIHDQDVVVSCTSNTRGSTLGLRELATMKDGALLFNAGSETGEFSSELWDVGNSIRYGCNVCILQDGADYVYEFSKPGLQKRIRILGGGYPINLHVGSGTSSEVIDVIFALMLLAAIKTLPTQLKPSIVPVGQDIETEIAQLANGDNEVDPVPALTRASELALEPRPYGQLGKIDAVGLSLRNSSLVRVSFRPGSETRGHYHLRSEEIYCVEKGSATISLWPHSDKSDPLVYTVHAGDCVTIPPGYVHHVLVTSEVDFVCLVFASPPFALWDQFFT